MKNIIKSSILYSLSSYSFFSLGKSFLLTGNASSLSLYTIGIGHPQYLCLDTPQSLSRKVIFFSPNFFLDITSIAFSIALLTVKSFKKSELIKDSLSQSNFINVEGVYSQLSSADEDDQSVTIKQRDRFIEMSDYLCSYFDSIKFKHLTPSAGLLKNKQKV